MEYIECTHCGKRYAVNDKIRNVEGGFVRCKNCLEKFMMVIHNSKKDNDFEATDGWDPTATVPPQGVEHVEPASVDSANQEIDWDPSLTIPGSVAEEESEAATLSEEEVQAKSEEVLRSLKAKKRNQYLTYAVLAALATLLGLMLYSLIASNLEGDMAKLSAPVVEKVNVKDLDKNNQECRVASAKLWVLDHRAMHETYNADIFVHMIEKSKRREQEVSALCENRHLIKSILDAATKGEKPDWFASEIKAITRK